MDKFIRKYELTVGKALSFYEDETRTTAFADESDTKIRGFSLKDRLAYEDTFTNKIFLAERFNAEDFDGVVIRSLNMEFFIEDGEGANPSYITIYNISDNARKLLEKVGKNNATVQLKCGYVSDTGEGKELPLVFLGEVESISETFEGSTRKTKITVKAGSSNIKNAYSVRTYKAGTPLDTIIKDIASDLKIPYGVVYLPRVGENSIALDKNLYAHGKSLDVLKAICTDYDLVMSIARTTALNIFPRKFEDNVSKTEYDPRRKVTGSDAGYAANLGQKEAITKKQAIDSTDNYFPERKGYKINKSVGFLISSDDNTLIGSPVLENGVDAQMENESGGETRIKFKTLMNGKLKVGTLVELRSRFYSGVYRLEKITYRGQYEGQEWYTECLASLDGSWKVEKSK